MASKIGITSGKFVELGKYLGGGLRDVVELGSFTHKLSNLLSTVKNSRSTMFFELKLEISRASWGFIKYYYLS